MSKRFSAGIVTAILFANVVFLLAPVNPCVADSPFVILGESNWKVHYSLTVRNHSSQPGVAEISVPLVPDDYPVQSILSKTIPPGMRSLKSKGYDNECGTWKMTVRPGESRKLVFSYSIRTRHVRWRTPIHPDMAHLNEHAETRTGGRYVTGQQALLLTREADRIAGTESYPLYRALSLYDYIQAHYSFNPHETRYGAIEALDKKTLQCSDAALLYCALASCSGIPATFTGGLFVEPGKTCYTQFHAWAKVSLPAMPWADVDPTLGRFDSGHRLRCFLERRKNYISFWRGSQDPFLLTQPPGKQIPFSVSFLITLTPCLNAGASSVPVRQASLSTSPLSRKGTGHTWSSRSSPAGALHYMEGMKCREKQDWEGAIRAYFDAIAVCPDYKEPVEAVIELYRKGIKRDMIHSGFCREVASHPGNRLSWFALGDVERERGHYTLSENAFTKAEHYGFRCYELYLAKMALYAMTKEIYQFEKAFHSGLSLECDDLDAYRKALLFCQDLEEWEQCHELAARGKVRFPGSAIFPGMEGYALLHEGEYRRALEAENAAISKDPSTGWYHCIRGWILLKMGRQKDAAVEIEKGIKLRRGVENPEFFRSLLTGQAE